MKFAIVLHLEIHSEGDEALGKLGEICEVLADSMDDVQGISSDMITVVTGEEYTALEEHLKGEPCGILVNGVPTDVSPPLLSYKEALIIASSGGARFTNGASVTYRHANQTPSEGILGVGEVVNVQPGTIINVAMTGDA